MVKSTAQILGTESHSKISFKVKGSKQKKLTDRQRTDVECLAIL